MFIYIFNTDPWPVQARKAEQSVKTAENPKHFGSWTAVTGHVRTSVVVSVHFQGNVMLGRVWFSQCEHFPPYTICSAVNRMSGSWMQSLCWCSSPSARYHMNYFHVERMKQTTPKSESHLTVLRPCLFLCLSLFWVLSEVLTCICSISSLTYWTLFLSVGHHSGIVGCQLGGMSIICGAQETCL